VISDGTANHYFQEQLHMDDAQMNSIAFVLNWYQLNVDARAIGARLEIGPDGNPTGRTIIMHECGLPDQPVYPDFIRACQASKDWILSSRKKWITVPKVKSPSMFGAIQSEENAAQEEHRNPSMSKALSIFRSQKSELSYDKILLLFDEAFGAYLNAIGRPVNWRW
jgi:hypothetical protein